MRLKWCRNVFRSILGNVLFFWDVFVIIWVIVTVFLVSFQAVYNASIQWQRVVTYLGDAIYLLYILTRFFRNYTNERGEIVTDLETKAGRYLQTCFVIDLLSILPIEVIAIPFEEVVQKDVFPAVLRFNRCLRLYRVWMFLHEQEGKLGTSTLLYMSLRLTFLAATSIHIIAGVWFAIACYNRSLVDEICFEDSWAHHYDTDRMNTTDSERYLISLYWAITTVTTVGYGDITPRNTLEKVVAIISILWGIILFGYILGALSSVLTNIDAQRTSYIGRLNVIKNILIDTHASQSLKAKVFGYYDYIWKKSKAINLKGILNQLPPEVLNGVHMENCYRVLAKNTLFKDCSPDFLYGLLPIAKQYSYVPKQVIICRGAFDYNMYVIQLGEVEKVVDSIPPLVIVLKKGDIFGDGCLVSENPSTVIVKARTHCEIIQLSKSSLENVFQEYPLDGGKLRKKIERRHIRGTESPSHSETSDTDDLEVLFVPRKKKFRLRKSQCFMRLWDIMISPLLPNSQFIITWDVFILLAVIFVCWMYMYQAAFTHLKPWLGYGKMPLGTILLVFTYGLDIIFIGDIIVSMKRATVSSTEIVSKSREILVNYVTSVRFVLDLLAVLPLELYSLIWLSSGQTWKFFPLFRLNRLLKFWKVVVFIRSIEGSLYFPIIYVNFFKFMVYILTLTHVGACLWFPIACFHETNCLKSSWAHSHGITSESLPWHDYLASFYWATATTTTVGYGDISATNTWEMSISIVVQLLGVVIYSYCLGSILATLNNTATPWSSFLGKLQAIKEFMSHHDKYGLLERINSYFELLWNQYRGQAIPGEEGLIDDLPKILHDDVMFKRCGALLSSVRFFRDLYPSEINQLAYSVYFYRFAPGDVIVYSGDVGRELFCVRRGHVEVLSNDLNKVVSVQGQGSYFGVSSFLGVRPCRHIVRANCRCEMVMLRREDADKIPSLKRELKVISENAKQNLSSPSYEEGLIGKDQKLKIVPKYSVAVGLVQTMNIISAITLKSSIKTIIAKCTDDVDIQSQVLGPTSRATRDDIELMRIFSYQEMTDVLAKDDKEEEDITDILKVEDRLIIKTKMYYKSHFHSSSRKLQKLLSYCILPCSILPGTAFSYIWRGTSFVLVIVFAVTISLQASFLHSSALLWTVNYALDCYFILDMVLSMYAAFTNTHGDLVSHPTICASHYLKTKFLIDFASSFPLDFLVLLMWTRLDEVSRVLSLTRANRLLKLYKLPLAFITIEASLKTYKGIVQTLKFSLYLALGTHLAACGWFLLACSSLKIGSYDPQVCDVSSWALHYHHTNPSTKTNVLQQYIVSLYWAIATTTTVGYGDIRAHTDSERGYACLVMVCGVLAYGYVRASAASNFVEGDNARRQYEQKMKALKWYLKEQEVDKALVKRAMRHYKRIWKINKGVDLNNLLAVMPPSLRADVSLNIYKSTIDQIPLFKNTELSFSRLLAMFFKPVVYLSNEEIIRKQDSGHELYFICNGSVEVVSEDGSTVYTTIGKGHFFGETGLVYHCPYHTTARAATNCELFVLTKPDLDFVLTFYPDIRDKIASYTRERLELINKLRLRPAKVSMSKTTKLKVTVGEKIDLCCYKLYRTVVLFIIPHDGLLGLMLYWLGLLISYTSFFSTSYQGTFQVKEPTLLFVNYFFEIFFLIEIVSKFHTTYEDKNGNTVKSLKQITIHYISTSFILDIIAIVPYEIFALSIKDKSIRMPVFLYVRFIHLIRIVRISKSFSDGRKNLNRSMVVLQLVKFFVLFSIVTQVVACIWYILACRMGECLPGTWASQAGMLPQDHTPHILHYLNCIYWAVVTMTTVGYGDMVPISMLETVFSMFVMVLGKFMLALVLGLTASALINADMQKMVFKNQFGALKKYLQSLNLSTDTRKRVLDMCEYYWVRNKGHSRTNILADLPCCMRATVAMEIGGTFLKKVPIFQYLDESFLRQLSVTLQSRLYIPGEFIVHRGQKDFGVVFLCRGEVEILQQEQKMELNQGDAFGLSSLLYDVPAGASLRTVTHVDMLAFSKEDFQEVCKNHPDTFQLLRMSAQEHYGLPIQLNIPNDAH